ncbi:MAG: carbohydrate kinase family protein [Candidatus Aenigmarchaeota archaeon]|nr:carbohydrate kinase family protein [Candidatus Aenigmarchaeota archaeon]
MKRFDVVGVGSLVVDFFTDSPYLIIEMSYWKKETFIALPTGKTLSRVVMRGGGSSGNTIAYLSKLGLKCGYFTKLGYDTLSQFLIDDLSSFGIDTSGILRERGLEAGKSIIVSSKGLKDHALVVDHGASDFLTKKDVEKKLEYVMSAEWIDLTSFTSKAAIEAMMYLVKKIKDSVKIFFAPSKTMISVFPKETLKILKISNAVSLNEEEAMILTKKNDLISVLKMFKKIGLQAFITRGKDGIVALFDGKAYKIGSYKVRDVKNTTGAGDVAAAWFLYGLKTGMDIKKILNYASVAAAFHVRSNVVGGHEGLPTRREIERYLKKVRDLPVREIKL